MRMTELLIRRWPVVALPLLAACGGGAKPPALAPVPEPAAQVAVDTVKVRDPEQDQQVARLQMQVYEKEAQLEELQARLDDARRDVVRAMAKLQTLASRAEAASGMAEAELAVQALGAASGGQGSAEVAQGARLLEQSTTEFNKQNFGGALYLANEAKNAARQGKSRLATIDRTTRPGEVPLAVPVRLQAQGRCNVREGPGTRFAVQFTLESGAVLTGYAYADDWVRVRDETGRTGWVFQSLVNRRREGTR
jgi:Bacterial SH3 domain